MKAINLTRFARARAGTDAMATAYRAAGQAHRGISCLPDAESPVLRVAVVEAFVPRGPKSDYGLVAIEFTRGGDATEIVVPFSRGIGPIFADSLALRADDSRVGLPEEFAESVLAAGVAAATALPCGSLKVIGAVHGLVGSSPRFFARLMTAAIVVLRFGLTDERTEPLLREALVWVRRGDPASSRHQRVLHQGHVQPERRSHLTKVEAKVSNLNDENFVILSLIQALVGAVSPNFRRVMLDCRGDAIHIQFVLAGESQEDRDEISDVEFEFQALLPTGVEVETTVLVSTDPLTRPPHPGRVAFARRE